MVSHAVRLSAGNLGGHDERRETFLGYHLWHTKEYATAFYIGI